MGISTLAIGLLEFIRGRWANRFCRSVGGVSTSSIEAQLFS